MRRNSLKTELELGGLFCHPGIMGKSGQIQGYEI